MVCFHTDCSLAVVSDRQRDQRVDGNFQLQQRDCGHLLHSTSCASFEVCKICISAYTEVFITQI